MFPHLENGCFKKNEICRKMTRFEKYFSEKRKIVFLGKFAKKTSFWKIRKKTTRFWQIPFLNHPFFRDAKKFNTESYSNIVMILLKIIYIS